VCALYQDRQVCSIHIASCILRYDADDSNLQITVIPPPAKKNNPSYREPWQVVLQTRRANAKGGMYVEDTVVYVSEERPEYNDAVAKLVAANAEMNV